MMGIDKQAQYGFALTESRFFHLLLLAMMLAAGCRTAQQGATPAEAEEYANTAMQLMKDKQYGEAVKWLKKAVKANPGLIEYQYELAYAHYALKDYKTAIKTLDKLVDDEQADQRYYWLLGALYDASGDGRKAEKTYRRGLDRFPGAGELYVDAGGLAYREGNTDKAVELWEEGIANAPAHASNYYWAAQMYCRSNEKVWGLIYGELFVLLKPNGERAGEMGRLLYETYQSAFEMPEGAEVASDVSFSEQAKMMLLLDAAQTDSLPFEALYEKTAGAVFAALQMDSPAGIAPDLETVCRFRYYFALKWLGDLLNERFPNVLFGRHDQLLENDLFDAYSHWLLRTGAPDVFDAWLKTGGNAKAVADFVAWNNDRPLGLSKPPPGKGD